MKTKPHLKIQIDISIPADTAAALDDAIALSGLPRSRWFLRLIDATLGTESLTRVRQRGRPRKNGQK